jgi:gamma-glutamylputrescine oxidase
MLCSVAPGAAVWEDRHRPSWPALAGDVVADVCVVGLGASGLAAVLELERLGRSVVGIDAGDVGGGAAGRNAGFLLAGLAWFHHDAAGAIGRERASALYRLTLDELPATPTARVTGSLRIAASPEELDDCRSQLDAMRADGLPAEPYEGPEGSGLLFPADGVFSPVRRCLDLAGRARSPLHERTPAIAISGGEVATPAGTVRCGAVVVAVDGRLEDLLPELRGEVRTARAQALATAPTPEVSLPRPVYQRGGYDYWQQLSDGRVVLGGCRDLAGGDWLAPGEACEPTPTVQGHLDALLGTLGVGAPVRHRWAGAIAFHHHHLRGGADPLPVLDEVRPGVWAAGAYNGTGNVVGVLAGRAAARLAAGEDDAFARLVRGGSSTA